MGGGGGLPFFLNAVQQTQISNYLNNIKKIAKILEHKQNPICHFRRVNGETKCNNLFSLYFLRNIREISLLKKIISEYEVA